MGSNPSAGKGFFRAKSLLQVKVSLWSLSEMYCVKLSRGE